MIIFWELLGSTKEVTFMRLYFFSYLFKIMISFIKQFKTNYITTYIKENVLQHSLCLYEHQSYSKWDKPRMQGSGVQEHIKKSLRFRLAYYSSLVVVSLDLVGTGKECN